MLSVVTLARNRNQMLHHFLRGWSEQRLDDLEIVIVRAGGTDDPRVVAERFGSLRVRHVELSEELDDDRIAYSHARNAGAAAAVGDRLVFCDAGVAAGLHGALGEVDALIAGDLLYLPPRADLERPLAEVAESARRHPRRPTPPTGDSIDLTIPHEMIWGLLHQHHDSFEPPLHQMVATLLNARRYRSKWGVWPMEGWLKQFERLGLISRQAGDVVIERLPTSDEIETHRCTCAAPFRDVP